MFLKSSGKAPIVTLMSEVEAQVVEAPLVEAALVQAPLVEAPLVQAPIVQAPLVQAPMGGEVRVLGARMAVRSTAELVMCAQDGDRQAYQELVERHQRQVWAAVRGFRLNEADASDAVQMTWLRLVENLARLTDPTRLGAWLTTTAKRECLRLIRRRNREIGTPEEFFNTFVDERDPGPEQRVTDAAMTELLWQLVNELPVQGQDLLRAVTCSDRPAYAEISKATGMAVGSIGPTRGRYLTRLRRLMEDSGLDATAWR